MLSYQAYEQKTGWKADMLLLLGDNGYWFGEDVSYATYIFKQYKADLRTQPMYSVPGNHELSSSLSATGKPSCFQSWNI